MKKYIINPVTGSRYEIRNSSSRVGRKPPPKGLWSQEKQDSTQNKPHSICEAKNDNKTKHSKKDPL